MADGRHRRGDHRRMRDHPQPLRLGQGAAEENRRRVFGHSLWQRRQSAQAGPQPAHRSVSGRLLARRWAARAALGTADVPGPFQELYLRQRAHGGRAEFWWARRPRSDEGGANGSLSYFVNFCNSQGWAAKSYLSFGNDPIDEFPRPPERVLGEFPNALFFTNKPIL